MKKISSTGNVSEISNVYFTKYECCELFVDFFQHYVQKFANFGYLQTILKHASTLAIVVAHIAENAPLKFFCVCVLLSRLLRRTR